MLVPIDRVSWSARYAGIVFFQQCLLKFLKGLRVVVYAVIVCICFSGFHLGVR